ncbi:long-chain fatty acid--CoA ligase [Aquincola sp. S2]|uniref:Long-chain-fatty-acid--CoA ligase n=1 Tax=Pseudaquabacterium terrae TaxID=2732868 RepID=A0ABX2EJ99_9BURK|nr:long-chain fatty acid--CoA ligase [Aquabacterium terrae]NRF68719.1 long-chain fatty acid--CoA ligase [Aquabacterium terrae]
MAEHPWIKSYPEGVRWDAALELGSVPQILDGAAARWPGLPALHFQGRSFTYRELKALCDRAAVGFRRLGVGPGVHVGLYLPNTPHYLIAFFGVLKAGGTVVNYSPLDVERVIEHKVEDSRTEIMVTLDMPALRDVVERLLTHTPLRCAVVGGLAEFSGDTSPARPAALPGDGRHLHFEDLLANSGDYERYPLRPDAAIAVLQYTGGTTGEPKAAMLTHANLSAACGQMWAIVNGRPKMLDLGSERVLVVLPLFHIYALVADMLFGLMIGAELVLQLRFEVDTALEVLSERLITVFPGVPTMFAAIVDHPDIARFDLRALRHCGSGGAPLPLEVAQQFQRLTGCSLGEGWGMTETAPTGTFTPAFGRRKPGSCGLPVPGVRIKIVDIDDPARELPLGERGEICIQGPNVMQGYWKRPEASAAAFTADGYLRTGDVGRMDEDGFVFIVDRCKDMILCSGFNVYPRNIEEAIYEHPAVAEVCVIGVPDAYRGQSPKAFVKLRHGAAAFALDELKQFLADKLGRHEMVQQLELRAELPKTPVGKLSKKMLVEEEQRRRSREAATSGSELSA